MNLKVLGASKELLLATICLFVLWIVTCSILFYSHYSWDQILSRNIQSQSHIYKLNSELNNFHIRTEEEAKSHKNLYGDSLKDTAFLITKNLNQLKKTNEENSLEKENQSMIQELKQNFITLQSISNKRIQSQDTDAEAIIQFHDSYHKLNKDLNTFQQNIKDQNLKTLAAESFWQRINVLIISLVYILAFITAFIGNAIFHRLLNKLRGLTQVLDATPDFVGITDKKGLTTYLNPAARKMMKISEDEVVTGIPIAHYHPREDTEKLTHEGVPKAIENGAWEGETNFLTRDGEIIPTSQVLISHKNKKGKIESFSTIARDIRELKKHEAELKISATVFDVATEAIIITDSKNNIINVNSAFSYITGYTKANVIGRNPSILSSGKQSKEFYEKIWSDLSLKGRWSGEVINKKKSGEIYTEWLSIVAIKNENNEIVRHIALFSDITQRKKAEEIIKQQATKDPLTGLPNRRLFEEQLEQTVSLSERQNNQFSVMFMDLDHFKEVNDTHGHDTGDLLLIQAAERLSNCLRKSDVLARLGGDEFALILPSAQDVNGAEKVAQTLLTETRKPFFINGHELSLTLSIGIALFPKNGKSGERLISAADKAMYYVKEHGRDAYKMHI